MTQLATPATGQVVAQTDATTLQTPATPAEQPLIAGKYKTEGDFWNGLNEVRGARGLPKLNVTGAGDGKPYAKIDDAVAEYSKLAGGQIQAASTFKDEDGFDVILAAAGVKPEELANAFTKNGKLDDAHYAAIKKAVPGVTKAMIDAQYKTQHELGTLRAQQNQAATEAIIQEGYAVFGSKEKYETEGKAILAKLSPAQQQDIVRRIAVPELAVGAIRELKAHGEAMNGPKQPSMVMGGMPSPPSPAMNKNEWLALKEAERRGDTLAAARLAVTPRETVLGFTK